MEVDHFDVVLPSMAGELHRSGQGHRESTILIREHAGLRVITVDMGFPVAGRVHNGPDHVTLLLALEVPNHGRWQSLDLADGMVYLYPPGGLHETIAGAGMRVGVVSIESDVVAEAAEDLGPRSVLPRSGFLRPDIAHDVEHVFRRVGFSEDPTALTAAVASILSTPDTMVRRLAARKLSSVAITRRAIDHVHDTGRWLPSNLALCRATGVSERRLQLAFADVYDMPPRGSSGSVRCRSRGAN